MQSFLSTSFVVLAGAFLLGVIYWVWQSARLLVARHAADTAAAAPSASRTALLEEKDALLRTLRELEMDRDVGKLSERDFERLNQRYRARAREVLRQLDAELEPHRERARAMIAKAIGDPGRT